MKHLRICFCFTFVVVVFADLQNVIEYEMKELLKNKEVLTEFESWEKQEKRPVKVNSFQWKDCGGPNSMATIKSLSINDPVYLPGALQISADINVKSSITTGLQGDVLIYKKIGATWIKVPCLGNFGSCHYDDICGILGQITQCPDALTQIGLNCHCPIKTKDYVLSKAEFDISAEVIPSGNYHFTANTTLSGQIAGCLDLYLDFD